VRDTATDNVMFAATPSRVRSEFADGGLDLVDRVGSRFPDALSLPMEPWFLYAFTTPEYVTVSAGQPKEAEPVANGASNYDNNRDEMLPFVPSSRRILEVGCDNREIRDGHLRERFGDIDLWGIDPTGPPGRPTEPLHDADRGSLPPDDLPSGERFDCIIFNDVLEHMVDPWAVVTQTKEFLTEQGSVVASIPNIRHVSVLRRLVLRGEWRYTDYGLLDRTHLRFFTRESILEMFRTAGYAVEIEPVNIAKMGWTARANRVLNSRLTDFLALEFAVVARGVSRGSDRGR